MLDMLNKNTYSAKDVDANNYVIITTELHDMPPKTLTSSSGQELCI